LRHAILRANAVKLKAKWVRILKAIPRCSRRADIHPQLSTVDFAKFVHAVRRSASTLRTWMYQLSEDASVRG
jgi:hypothetical protein